jgi:enoyl-CoA hydratase/carnithine racemase
MIDVYATTGTFARPHDLAQTLASTLMAIEGVPDIPMFRRNTAAFVHELVAGALSNVEGESSYVRVQVLTNAGALDRAKQLAVVEQFTRLIAEASADPAVSERTWVLLTEAVEGGWGLLGEGAYQRRAGRRCPGRDRPAVRAGPMTLFRVEEPTSGYWRVVYANPPINLLTSATVVELRDLVSRIETEPALRVVVFASENPDFWMARYDLSDTNPIAFAPTDSGVTPFIDSTLRLGAANPITIASLRGRARGGGSEFALACDLRFASAENTVLGQPEVGGGILPGGGAVERLAALVGPARALEIIASSDDYDGSTAERYGWVNRALPDGELDGFVDALARRLASFEAGAIATVKHLVRRHSPAAGVDDYRETLQALRTQLTRPASAARREKVREQALRAGADFEFHMGHHLGLVGS